MLRGRSSFPAAAAVTPELEVQIVSLFYEHYSSVCLRSSSPGVRLSDHCRTARAVTGGNRGGEPVL